MRQELKGLLLKFDIFTKTPQVYITSQSSHKTMIGFIGSLCLYTILALCIYTFGREMVERQFPITSTKTKQLQKRPILNLQPSNLPLSFSAGDPNNNFIRDPEIGYFMIQYISFNKYIDKATGEEQLDFKIEELVPEICTSQHMKMQGTDSFWKNNQLQNYFCFPLGKQFQIGGSFLLGESYDINIIFYKCSPSSTQKCKAQNIIDEALKLFYINIMTPVIALDPSSSDVVSLFYKSQWTGISAGLPKASIITFKKVEVDIDQAILFEEIQSTERVTFSRYREMVQSLDQDQIFQFQLQVDNQFDTVLISYQKVQQVIAEIGGFVNIAFVLLGVIFSPFIEIDFYNTVLKNNISLLSEVSSEELIEQKQQKKKKRGDSQKDNYTRAVFPGDQELKVRDVTESDVEKEIKIKKNYQEKSFKNIDVMQIALGIQKSDQHALYQAAKQEIENGLSVQSLIKLRQEFEILQNLVLDKELHRDFQQISKQSIIFSLTPPLSKNQSDYIAKSQADLQEKMLSCMNRFVFEQAKSKDKDSSLAETQIYFFKADQQKKLDTITERIQFYVDHLLSSQRSVFQESYSPNPQIMTHD